MEIDYVKIENFRQYKDQTINFTQPEREKNFTIVLGANGAGKTNLLNAITWCLYGEELHMGTKYKGLPLINTTTFRELNIGESCNVKVELQLKEKSGKKILISRNLEFRKTNRGRIQRIPDHQSNYSDGSSIMMMREIGRDWVRVSEPHNIIDRLIPKNLERYFFFDGERLDQYFRETTGETIRKAVFEISQLGLLEKAITHLTIKRNDFLRQTKGLSPKAQEIRELLNTLRRSVEVNVEDLKILNAEKADAERKEIEFSAKLRNSSIGTISKLENQRIELENEIKGLESDFVQTEDEKFGFLIEVTPKILLYNPLIKTSELISRRKEAGDIPPNFKRVFLEKLLEDGECICGTDLVKEREHRSKIEDLLKESNEISDISEEIIELNATIRSLLLKRKDFEKLQIKYGKRLKLLEREVEQKKNKLNAISKQIGEIDIEKVKMWESKRQEWKQVKEDLIGKIRVLKYQIERLNNIIRAREAELKRELKKEERFEKLLKTLSFCDECLKAAIEIKETIMEDIRKEIEEKTKKQFFDLIWKKETYIDVKIDDNYNISVLHQSGMEGIGTLSAGERQVLALSFMAALNSVSGFDVPIIIDTPLGRISREPRKSIASNLPNYLKEKQVTLLVTEEEYTPEVRERLSDRVGKSYIIKFQETGNGNLAEVVPFVK